MNSIRTQNSNTEKVDTGTASVNTNHFSVSDNDEKGYPGG